MVFDDEWPLMMEREAGMRETVPPVQVGFGLHPILDGKASEKAGFDVYKDVEFIKILIPGDRLSDYFQPATDEHRQRFPRAYAAFKARDGGERIQGMRIEQWPPISRAMALTFRAAHIFTVEALAEVHEGYIDKLGNNARALRDKARAWLAAAKDNAETMRLAAANQTLKDEIASTNARMEAMEARMQEMLASAAPRRGRPPKDAEAA